MSGETLKAVRSPVQEYPDPPYKHDIEKKI